MAALTWLLIPVAAAVVAGVWGAWANRRRSATPDAVGVAGYERFRAAMERSSSEADGVQTEGAQTARPRAAAVAHTAPDGPARAAD